MANSEAPNDLLSTGIFKVTDVLCEGVIDGFVQKSGIAGTNPLVSTYFNNVPVMNPDGSFNYNISGEGFFFGYTYGESGQSVPARFGKVETLIPLSFGSRLAKPPVGAGEQKNVVVSFNTDQYPDADSIRVTFRVPSLLVTDDDGNINGFKIAAKIEVSLNGSAFYVPAPYNTGTVEVKGKCTSPYLFDTIMTLPKTNPASSRYEWKVRVSRVTENILSIRTQNEIFVEAISVISTNSFSYRNTALVFSEISANQFSAIPARAYEINGLLLKVPSGHTPTIYNLDGTITPAVYPTVWDGTWAGGGELLRNGDFTQPLTGDWEFGPNVLSQSTETANPPPGQTQYLKVVANGTTDWVLDPYQPSFSASIISGKKYRISGWYKTSSTEGNLEVRIKSNDVSFELTAQTDWTYFEQDVIAGNGSWVSWRWILGRGLVTNQDILYLSTLSVRDIDEGKVWTNNPAWIFYDLLTNKRYGLGKYIQENLLDKWTLYKIAQYCDEMVDDGKGGLEPRFTCNVAIQTRKDAYQLLQNFVSVFQGMIYWASDRIITSQVRDTKEIQLFTNANVIDGRFSYSDTAKNTRSTVVKVKWMNPENFYKETVEIVEDIDGIARYGRTEKEITAFACTSKGQAIRAANWVLLTERYMTETITFQAGMEGIYTAPGEIFSVYDNFRKNSQQGGCVLSFNGARDALTLDRQVFLRPGYTYQLSATVPKESYDIESVTGSDQINFIQNSQVETRNVTSNTGYNTILSVDSGFSSGLYNGSIWQLSAIGTDNVLAFAQKYRCLATSEPSKGIVEILGVEWNTGIPYRVDTDYNVLPNPINSGDQAGVLPPSNLVITTVTGDLLDNSVYRYLNISWDHSASTNKAAYEISGQAVPSGWQLLKTTPDNSYNYNVFGSGQYNFSIRTVSDGGVFSTPLTGGYYVTKNNPFGAPPELSAAFVQNDQDTRLGASGYFGNSVTVGWSIPTGRYGLDVPESNYIAGYRFHALNPTNNAELMTPVIISGAENTTYNLTWNQIAAFSGGPRRDIKAYIETFDTDNVFRSGASIVLNNPACTTVDSHSFFGITGSLNYTINENDFDIPDMSGVMFWYNVSNSFTPTYSNVQYQSKRLSGLINVNIIGAYYAWYSLIDTFGTAGSTIVGPIPVTGNSATGPKGDTGNYQERIFLASMTTPPTPVGNNPAGWSTTRPSPVGTAIWSSVGTKDNAGNLIGVWSTPNRDSGNILFYQTSQPTGTALVTGDTWFDTDDDNKIWKYNGATWDAAFVPFPKLDANGNITNLVTAGDPSKPFQILATAFQIWNGTSVDAPFEIVGGVTYIKNAQIQTVSAGKITAGTISAQAIVIAGGASGLIRSNNYSAGTAGWQIDGTGAAEFNNVTVRGSIYSATGTIAGWTIGTTDGISSIAASGMVLRSDGAIYCGAASADRAVLNGISGSTHRLYIGSDDPTTAPFRVTKEGALTATGVNVTGTITSTSGIIGGFTIGANTLSNTNLALNNSGTPSVYVFAGGSSSTMSSTSLIIGTGTNTLSATDSNFIFGSTGGVLGTYSINSLSFRASSGAPTITFGIGSATNIFRISSTSGAETLEFGSDTNLYRSAANLLKTDDAFHVGDYARVMSNGYPADGAGLELAYDATTYGGIINAYDRTNSVFKKLLIEASEITLGINNTQVTKITGDLSLGLSMKKTSSDGWTPALYDGDNNISFKFDAGSLKVKIDSTEYTITIT